jgi:hypothetical protein
LFDVPVGQLSLREPQLHAITLFASTHLQMYPVFVPSAFV